MDRICGKYGAALFQGEETPKQYYNKGRTEVGIPETDMYEDDNNDFGDNKGTKTRVNKPINPNKQAINNILYSINPITRNLTEDYKDYRLYSI